MHQPYINEDNGSKHSYYFSIVISNNKSPCHIVVPLFGVVINLEAYLINPLIKKFLDAYKYEKCSIFTYENK